MLVASFPAVSPIPDFDILRVSSLRFNVLIKLSVLTNRSGSIDAKGSDFILLLVGVVAGLVFAVVVDFLVAVEISDF